MYFTSLVPVPFGGDFVTQLIPWSLPSDAEGWTYRMKDLCDLTGLGRQAIHFYIQRGLLPPGRKTGRNMAYYGEAHVKRLQLIKKLQHERFLPLKAIKAILDDQKGAFSESQEGFLAELKARLVGTLADDPERPQVPRVASEVLLTNGIKMPSLFLVGIRSFLAL